jgi:hypothetical protein
MYKEENPLKKFAFLGVYKEVEARDEFTDKLKQLASIAEEEVWYYDSPNAKNEYQREYAVLYQYIHHTFGRAQDEGKILIDNDRALMNTGLLTLNGEEIYMLFTHNRNYGYRSDAQKWYFDSFCKESSRRIPEKLRSELPDYVNYFAENPQDMYFNTALKIEINMDHILNDHFERLPEAVKSLPLDVLRALFSSAETILKKRITRNNRLVVPQYYNKKIAYLAPLMIANEVIPLAIEKNDGTYRVNTVFTQDIAYCNARLLTKPESNWLINERKKR